jgi:predicted dehydrogenase
MVKCGIVGLGKMGRIRAKAIEDSGHGQVVGYFDPYVKDFSNYKNFTTIKDLIESEDIEAIFVCTPNNLIPEICLNALSLGKHVFSEKPPAFNAMQLKGVLDIEAKMKGFKLMYGFNHRHHESIMKMKEIVDDNSLGKVLWMRGRYGKEVDENYFSNWRAKPDIAGGGILLDQGIHMVDLMLHFGGHFHFAHSFISNLFWKIEGIEDNVFAILKNKDSGVTASIHSTMTQWRYLFSLEVFLEGGALILNGLKTSSGAYGDEILTIKRNPTYLKDGKYENEEVISYHIDTSWLHETTHFLESIVNNTKIKYGTSADAMKLMNLIDMIYQSDVTKN